MKKVLSSVISYSVPFMGLAAAGFADRYNDYRNWILVAYKYCFLIGIISVIVLMIICWLWKDRFDYLIERLINYCKSNSLAAIIILGTCLSVILGIVTGVTGLELWILNIIPLYACLFLIPFWMFNTTRRNWFLRKNIFYCLLIPTIAAVMSSLGFILLTLSDLLPDANEIFVSIDRRYLTSVSYTHPWLSLLDIWTYVFIYIGDVVICLIFLWIKNSIGRSYSFIKGYFRNPVR